MEVFTKSASETQKLGRKVANNLRGLKGKTVLLALTGDLGSGKTTFLQGLAKGLGITTRILSPTFVLVREHRTPQGKYKTFYHIDLYRLEENIKNELLNIGLWEAAQVPGNVIAIEWAEKAEKFLSGDTLWIKFKNLGGDKRLITIPNTL